MIYELTSTIRDLGGVPREAETCDYDIWLAFVSFLEEGMVLRTRDVNTFP